MLGRNTCARARVLRFPACVLVLGGCVMAFRFVFGLAVASLVGMGSAQADGYAKGGPGPECCRWTGFYVGAHGGYGWGALIPPTQETGLAREVSLSGGFGGLQTGYNHQVAPNWFFGVEQDIWLGNISGSEVQRLPAPRIESEAELGGTVRARFGYVLGHQALLYSTAGIAWAYNKGGLQYRDAAQQALAFADRLTYSERNLHLGFALGNGLEWAIDRKLSVKAEYQFLYLTKEQYFAGTTEGALAGFHAHTLRLGINWRLQ
jgi:opacity protein-like surface antigen